MLYTYQFYSLLGLIFDIIGVLMLFKYGLPSKLKEHSGGLLLEENPKQEKQRIAENSKITKWAYSGLTLLIIGFLFQIIGTIMTL